MGAHGLYKINGRYPPYGSGRDWFFIGDYQYRNGRRTPDPNERHKAKGIEPLMQRRGRPRDMALTMARSKEFRPNLQDAEKHCSCPACPPSHHNNRWASMHVGPRNASNIASEFARSLQLNKSSSSPAV